MNDWNVVRVCLHNMPLSSKKLPNKAMSRIAGGVPSLQMDSKKMPTAQKYATETSVELFCSQACGDRCASKTKG